MMRQSTLEKKSQPIVAWLRERYQATGYYPYQHKVWEQCAIACESGSYEKRRENARQLFNYCIQEVSS